MFPDSLATLLSSSELLSLQRAFLLLMPCAFSVLLWLRNPPTARVATGLLVALLWNLPALLLLNVLAIHAGWWQFAPGVSQLLDLPVDVWIGWALWWGPIAAMLAQRWGIGSVVVVMAITDFISMPLLEPLVVLGPNWQWGEPVALLLSLLPALMFAKWTAADREPLLRTGLHIFGWGGYVMWVLPACALAWESRSLISLLNEPFSLLQWILLPIMLLCLLAGVAAAVEFARVGDGTPIPYDPPKRVVSSGPYAYVANTMQLTSAALMLCWAAFAHSFALLAVAASFAVFDILFASAYNRVHIAHAFPGDWLHYRQQVREWLPRWRPYHAVEPAYLYVGNATPCLVRFMLWLARRSPSNLLVRAIPVVGEGCVTLRYEAPGLPDAEYGFAALGRTLEHIHLAYALLGWVIRLPGIAPLLDRALGLALRLHYGLVLAHA